MSKTKTLPPGIPFADAQGNITALSVAELAKQIFLAKTELRTGSLNDVMDAGFYILVGNDMTDGPLSSMSRSVLFVTPTGLNSLAQILIVTAYNRVFVRSMYDGTWSTWNNLAIVGGVNTYPSESYKLSAVKKGGLQHEHSQESLRTANHTAALQSSRSRCQRSRRESKNDRLPSQISGSFRHQRRMGGGGFLYSASWMLELSGRCYPECVRHCDVSDQRKFWNTAPVLDERTRSCVHPQKTRRRMGFLSRNQNCRFDITIARKEVAA